MRLQRPQLFGKTLFTDFLLSNSAVLLAWMMLTAASHQEKQEREEANVRTYGEYAVTIEWPDGSPDDVDLYVRDPTGVIVYFSARDEGLMHLEHDDQGAISDHAQTESGEYTVDRNEERVIMRGMIPGEYVVNVHMYNKRSPRPTPVTIRLIRLKGDDAELVKKVRVLADKGDEATAFRFTERSDGSIGDINELEGSFMGAQPRPAGNRSRRHGGVP